MGKYEFINETMDDYDALTLQDCIDFLRYKQKRTVINDGGIMDLKEE